MFVVFTVILTASRGSQAQVDPALRAQLLSTLSPVVYPAYGDDHPPLPIDWYVRHCRLLWFTPDYFGTELGNTGNTPMTIRLTLALVDAFNSKNLNYFFTLQFRDGNWRVGEDPADPMTWAIAQARGVGIYGSVRSAGTNRYNVQYYMVFGYNNPSAPDICGDVEPGSHEGDWIAISLWVEATDPARPRIYDAVYHNHGRAIFVESPAAIRFEGTHPTIFLERGVQETWPYAGDIGFTPGNVPPCVSTNSLWNGIYVPEVGTFAGESGYYPVVREHVGQGPRYLVTSVVDVTTYVPGSGSEAEFFHRFSGWWGSEIERDCLSFAIVDTTCPPSPRHQDKIWDNNFVRTRAWATYDNQPLVIVDPGRPGGPEDGSATNPFNRLDEALAVVAPGGTILLRPGSSNEKLTIFENCTLNAAGGPVTIGAP
jgi:hypothetical protein